MNADRTQPMNDPNRPVARGTADAALDDRFDAIARARHVDSLERLSARTQARLAQARRPTARPGLRLRPAWALPTVLAAMAVLAIAVQLRPEPATAPAATSADTALVAAGTTSTDPAAVLDENPDLYLWLASTDDVMPTSPEY